MTLTERDRKLLKIIVPVAFAALFWVLLLGPARADLAAAEEELVNAQSRHETARAAAARATG